MARREWADKIVAQQYGHEDDGCIAGLLRKEHARAVRVVKREIDRIKKDQYTFRVGAKDSVLNELQRVLDLLTKGRA
ncbi:MAG: hypothetical protein HRU82_02660 [Nitrospira sp.]|nr:MAG: hypothetical protein HRU82_02660 [Nitrospira sp.]